MTGAAVVHGVANNGTALTLSFIATFIGPQRMEAEHQFDHYDVKDNLGFTATSVAFDEKAEIVVDLTPSGATRAIVAALNLFPIPIESVTIANCKVTGGFISTNSAVFNGVYSYMGGARAVQTSAEAFKLTGVRLRMFSNAAQNTSLTTTVVG